MSEDVIRIDGRGSIIVNTSLKPEMGLFIAAEYKDSKYPIARVHPLSAPNEDINLAILRFDREDRRVVSGELNHILIMTSLKVDDVYRAVGVDCLPEPENDFARSVRWHRLGDPRVVVTPSAKDAIKNIRTYERELKKLLQNQGGFYGFIPGVGFQN